MIASIPGQTNLLRDVTASSQLWLTAAGSDAPLFSTTASLSIWLIHSRFSVQKNTEMPHIQSEYNSTVNLNTRNADAWKLIWWQRQNISGWENHLVQVLTVLNSDSTMNIQESRADAGVSTRQSRHLAINYEFWFISSDWRSNLCCHLAKALEQRQY